MIQNHGQTSTARLHTSFVEHSHGVGLVSLSLGSKILGIIPVALFYQHHVCLTRDVAILRALDDAQSSG